MSIVINTPNGNIGRTLAHHLLDVGEAVTIISRSPDKVKDLTDRGARLVQGSTDDRDVLESALQGARALFWVTPPASAPNYHEWSLNNARTAAEVARAAGVKTAVVLSSVGAQHGRGSGPVGIILEVELTFQRAIENVAMLRAGFFLENFLRDIPGILGGTVYSPVSASVKMPMVATKDIAHKAAAYLLSPNWAGHVVTGVHGPRDLSNGEAFAEIGRILGRDIKYVNTSVERVGAANRP